mmetsp:Transcript_3138/g.3721  ORF Transcript_3138/g.3721 Transcript_3138/m.3721 type:complete len:246 (+) Transcript_3138:59-796(+)
MIMARSQVGKILTFLSIFASDRQLFSVTNAFHVPSYATRSATVTVVPFSTFDSSLTRKPFQAMEHDSESKSSSTSLAMGMWDSDNDQKIMGKDRLLACAPYILPLCDGDQFGKYIFQRIPAIGQLDYLLLGGFHGFFNSVPLSSFGLFLLFAFQSRNMDLSRAVRFNFQQAILIDIALIFPELFSSISGSAGQNLPRIVLETSSNLVFYTYAAAIGYSVISNLLGEKPDQIPVLSEAAEQSIGPM